MRPAENASNGNGRWHRRPKLKYFNFSLSSTTEFTSGCYVNLTMRKWLIWSSNGKRKPTEMSNEKLTKGKQFSFYVKFATENKKKLHFTATCITTKLHHRSYTSSLGILFCCPSIPFFRVPFTRCLPPSAVYGITDIFIMLPCLAQGQTTPTKQLGRDQTGNER